ncbi:MAG TPA: plastocyanin/azurin family copper-binding protein [Gemmatimonadaceae bacterium]|nr:plastocyanin/azurin family copper-binding protein [Gemmatimonadaceae bacterium]
MTMRFFMVGALGASLLLPACNGGDQPADHSAPTTPAASAGATPSGRATPDAGGKVVTVEMITDENGNYFKPADFEVRKGDVIRYTLAQGVHNVHFVADSNPTMQNPPPASQMLQLPGQTTDVKVEWEPGRYYYQCDPHALLGMVGHVTVTP